MYALIFYIFIPFIYQNHVLDPLSKFKSEVYSIYKKRPQEPPIFSSHTPTVTLTVLNLFRFFRNLQATAPNAAHMQDERARRLETGKII